MRNISQIPVLALLLGTTIMVACAPATELDTDPTQSLEITQPVRQPSLNAVTAPGIMPLEEETRPSSPTPASTNEASGNRMVIRAKEDLAQRLSIDIDEIQLVEFRSVVWPDTSLGCSQPGMIYAQVITPGFRITLEAKGQRYAYHTDASQYVVLCERKETPVEPVPLMPVAPHGKPLKCQRTPCPKLP